jgi:integrase
LEHCCFHSLKDTSATLLADLGADELLTKKRMGHKDISTTLRHYTHLSPGREKELVERMGKTFCAANVLHEEAKAVAD